MAKKKKSFKQLKATACKVFSEYIRRKDARAGFTVCYTCGKPSHWKVLQCGHAVGGRHMAVLFDEELCRPQCVSCNVFKRGNYPIFTTKLIKENGMAWWERKLENSRKVVKYNRVDLETLIDGYKAKVLEFE